MRTAMNQTIRISTPTVASVTMNSTTIANPNSTFGLCRRAAKARPSTMPKVIGCNGMAPFLGAGVQV